MKLAISDFDNTIYFPNNEEKISKADINAIKVWQKENKFIIATGRDYRFLKELLPNEIKPDGFICLTGASIYDETGTLIEKQPMDNFCFRHLFELNHLNEPSHIACFTPYSLFVNINKDDSWFLNTELKNRYIEVDTFFISCLKGVCQVNLQYDSIEKAQKVTSLINEKIPQLTAYNNKLAVDIIKKDVNKAQGVLKLKKIKNWQFEKIFAFGDGSNDLPMLKHFKGAFISSAKDDLKKEVNLSFNSLADYLNSIKKDELTK